MRESDQANESKKMTKIKILGQGSRNETGRPASQQGKTCHPRKEHKGEAEEPGEDQTSSLGPMVFAFQRQESKGRRTSKGAKEAVRQGSSKSEDKKESFSFHFAPQPLPPEAPSPAQVRLGVNSKSFSDQMKPMNRTPSFPLPSYGRKTMPSFMQEIGKTITLEKLAILVDEYEAGRITEEDFIQLKAWYLRALQQG